MKFLKSKSISTKFLIAGFLFFSLFILTPNPALAATAYLTPNFESVAVGDTVIVNVEMDTTDKRPNVVEGNILIKSGAEKIKISKLSVAGSALTFWPQNPFLDKESLIFFTGGTPGGFNQKSGLLFKIVFLAKQEGQVVFLPANFKAYNNDENSTPIDVSINPLTITIGPKSDFPPKDQWLEIISKDTQLPQDLSATVGQDNSMFEGKKFITISAIDNESGIDYYEVTEGNWPTIRSEKTYVLIDQSESSVIIITAYDKAGNSSKILLRPGKPKIGYGKLIIILIISLILLCILFILFKLVKKKNVKNI